MRPHSFQIGMHYDAASGGADRYFSGLLGGLEHNHFPFTAAAFGDPISADSEWGHRLSFGSAQRSLPRRLAAVRHTGQTLTRSPDLLVSHFALYAWPLLGQFRSIPHVVHFHGPWADESNREFASRGIVFAKRWIERRVYRSADRFIVLSESFREILSRNYAIPVEKITVIPGGVEVQHFQPTGTRMEARQRLGWPREGRVLFCVRRLVNRMGLDHLIRAFAELRNEFPDLRLVIGGRGPLQAELTQQIQAAGLAERIRLAGFIADSELPSAYTAADFSIVPSQALEGFGLTAIESLACGTPVLVTPVGGLPETVQGLDPSLILAGSDEAAIATGLRRALNQPLPSPTACRNFARENFAWEPISRRIDRVYEEAYHDSLY